MKNNTECSWVAEGFKLERVLAEVKRGEHRCDQLVLEWHKTMMLRCHCLEVSVNMDQGGFAVGGPPPKKKM